VQQGFYFTLYLLKILHSNFLDGKAKRQPWIVEIWMKKPNLDEDSIKIGWLVILHPKYRWM
jgi:hypothetical protein